MNSKVIRELKQTAKHYHAIEGNNVEFVETGKMTCANEKCTSRKRAKELILEVYQHGMLDDIAIRIVRCKTCKENTAFTYSYSHEVNNTDNGELKPYVK